MSGCAAQYSRTRGNRARLPVERGFERSATLAISLHIFHRDGDRLGRIPDRKGGLLVARLAEVEDIDARVVRHPAAIARDVGLAVAVDVVPHRDAIDAGLRSEEHTSELQSLMRISYAVFCLKKKSTPSEEQKYNRNHTI